MCSFSLEVVRGWQSDFDLFSSWGGGTAPSPDPIPIIEHFGIFFQKPTLNNPSVMCHCKCIIAQLQSAWMPTCLLAWGISSQK